MKKFAIIAIVGLMFGNLSFTFAAEKKSLQWVLTSVGCKVVKRDVSNPTKWEKEEFNLQVKQSFLVKFRAKDGLLYKFLVEEESFANEEGAKRRLPRIQEFPPELKEKYGTHVDKLAAEYLMREGFVLHNKVYIVSTFTYKLELEGDLHHLREKIEKAYRE